MSDKPDHEAARSLAAGLVSLADEHPVEMLRMATGNIPATRIVDLARAYLEIERDHRAMEALRRKAVLVVQWEDDCTCCGHSEGMWLVKMRPPFGLTGLDPADTILAAVEKTNNGK